MNLDVIQTIKNPLDRSKNLHAFKIYMRIGLFIITVVNVLSVVYIAGIVDETAPRLSRSSADYQTYKNMSVLLLKRATIDMRINSFFNFYTIF